MKSHIKTLSIILVLAISFLIGMCVGVKKVERKERVLTTRQMQTNVVNGLNDLPLKIFFCSVSGEEGMNSVGCKQHLENINEIQKNISHMATYMEKKDKCDSDFRVEVLGRMKLIVEVTNELKTKTNVNMERLEYYLKKMVTMIDVIDFKSCSF